jgi:fumarate hydratase class I
MVEDMDDYTKGFVELIRRCSTDLPEDVEQSLSDFMDREEDGSSAKSILGQILNNVALARERSLPICQDTGTNVYWVDYPASMRELDLREQIVEATKQATAQVFLRPNSVDPLTGKNSGNNIGEGHPYLHFHQWEEDYLRVRLLLKGGGCENCGVQYKLPDSRLNAGRDLDGVAKCVRDAAFQAQGRGCAPGALGVCVGGDRGSSHEYAKLALLRRLDEPNPVPELDKLEKRLVEDINKSGIGPMGLGGKTTVFGVRLSVANRIPASYFVSVAYMCWAYRRRTMTLRDGLTEYE